MSKSNTWITSVLVFLTIWCCVNTVRMNSEMSFNKGTLSNLHIQIDNVRRDVANHLYEQILEKEQASKIESIKDDAIE